VRYWWVNQKQTYRHEVGGGYIWSPKRRADGARNQFYENMKVVAPNDLLFSYWDTAIRAYGYVRSFGYDAPKPDEFGTAGHNWSLVGYRADVQYVRLTTPVHPNTSLDKILPLLPAKYSPLHPGTGKGLQSVYLAALPAALGQVLWQLVLDAHNPLLASDVHASVLSSHEVPERELWERHEIELLDHAKPTERQALIMARRGQGQFRANVAAVERQCRVTKVSNAAYLIASHIKPWRHANNAERLSPHNGLLLAPQVDFLFDRGFISFADGKLLVSEVAHEATLVKLGIDPARPPEVGRFDRQQEAFLEFHRGEIFRSAAVR
jgi:putative restriction endonuclease